MVVAAILACTLALAPGSDGDPSPPIDRIAFHVRAIDPRAQEWIRAGATASPTFRALLSRLAESDLIVYVEIVDRLAGGAAGQMYFITATGGTRYLRIELVADRDTPRMVALLGHELQHTAEVADAPSVRDSRTLGMLYLGMLENAFRGTQYDSAAARVTEDRVKGEVTRFRGPPAGAGVRPLTHSMRGSDHFFVAGGR
jgi:hypothetical protein